MTVFDAILHQWLASVMAAYSAENQCFLSGEQDRFRNPVGHLMRENLALLLGELFGAMDVDKARGAIAAIVRVRTVQDLDEAQVVGFFDPLRLIVAAMVPAADSAGLNGKIDLLSLLAGEEFARCRTYLANIRQNERRRAMAVPTAMFQARS